MDCSRDEGAGPLARGREGHAGRRPAGGRPGPASPGAAGTGRRPGAQRSRPLLWRAPFRRPLVRSGTSGPQRGRRGPALGRCWSLPLAAPCSSGHRETLLVRRGSESDPLTAAMCWPWDRRWSRAHAVRGSTPGLARARAPGRSWLCNSEGCGLCALGRDVNAGRRPEADALDREPLARPAPVEGLTIGAPRQMLWPITALGGPRWGWGSGPGRPPCSGVGTPRIGALAEASERVIVRAVGPPGGCRRPHAVGSKVPDPRPTVDRVAPRAVDHERGLPAPPARPVRFACVPRETPSVGLR
ncbi:hypothetical protein BH24ACT4_BH24ACT4_01400 [soil metagenome]